MSAAPVPARSRLRGVGARRRSLLVSYGLALLFVVVLGATTRDGFAPERILGILGQNAQLGMAVVGQAVVLLSGGLDLAVGPVMNLSGIVSASVMDGDDGKVVPAIAAALGAGAAVGLGSGLLVAVLRIAPLLATLALGTVVQGIYYVWTGGQPKGAMAPGFRDVADDRIGGLVPVSLLAWLALWGVVAFVLFRTTWGRGLYATGANAVAARLSGIATTSRIVGAYLISGVCAAAAGIQLTAYSGNPSTSAADAYTLTTVTAVVIGGVAFTGGRGGLAGPFAGVCALIFLQTILSTLGVPSAAQYIAQGLVLVIMMLVNVRLDPAQRRDVS